MNTTAYHASLAAMLSKQLGCKVDVSSVAAAIGKAKVCQSTPIITLPAECMDMAGRVSEIDAQIKQMQAERDRLTSILDKVAYPLYEARSNDEGRFLTQCHVDGTKLVYCGARHMVKPTERVPLEWTSESEPTKPKRYVRQDWFDEVHRDPSLQAHGVKPTTFFKVQS